MEELKTWHLARNMKDKEFIIRETNNLDELHVVEKLQGAALGYPEMQVLGSNEMATIQKNGGVILIVYDDQVHKAIGFLIGFVGSQSGEIYQHLLSMGVLPDYRSIGIGFGLVSKQIEYAQMQGIEYITSYIDPLQGSISKLIVGKFRGKVMGYFPNLFGSGLEGIDRGLDTDRFSVRINIKNLDIPFSSFPNPDAEQLLDKTAKVNETLFHKGFRKIIGYKLDLNGSRLLVEVPHDIQKMKSADMGLAQDWRSKVRDIFGILIPKYHVVDFVSIKRSEVRNFFVFELLE